MLNTRCDFCSRPFDASAWNQRTCVSCATLGCPDQSNLEWSAYQTALKPYLRSIGRLAPLSGSALSAQIAASSGTFDPRRAFAPKNVP